MKVTKAREYAIKYKLEGFEKLEKYSDADLVKIVGKCGPGSGFLEFIVPETMWCMSVTPA